MSHFIISFHLGIFFIKEYHLEFCYWAHVLRSHLPNKCIHWKWVPYNVRLLFMLKIYPIVLKVSLLIFVRTSSEIICHWIYLVLNCYKSCILSHIWCCLPMAYWVCLVTKYVLSKKKKQHTRIHNHLRVESLLCEDTFTVYFIFNFLGFLSNFRWKNAENIDGSNKYPLPQSPNFQY